MNTTTIALCHFKPFSTRFNYRRTCNKYHHVQKSLVSRSPVNNQTCPAEPNITNACFPSTFFNQFSSLQRQGSQSIATIPSSSSDSSAAQNHFGSNPDLIPDKTSEWRFLRFLDDFVVTTTADVEPGGSLSDLDSSLLLNSGGLPTGPIEHSSLSRRPQKVFHK